MKLITMIALLFTTQAFADTDNINQFTGRYKPVADQCVGHPFDDATRVYMNKSKDQTKTPVFEIHAYNQDAALVEIPLGQGTRQTPGTDPTMHGKVSDSWSTVIVTNQLRSTVITVRDSMGIRFVKEIYMVNEGSTVTYIERYHEKGKVTTAVNCKLVRY